MKITFRVCVCFGALLLVSCGGLGIPGGNSTTSGGPNSTTSAAPVQASGDPRQDVKKALTAMFAAKSFRARLTTTTGNVMDMEFVAPDRFHTKGQSQSEGQPPAREMIIIGKDTFVRLGNMEWRQVPAGMGLGETVQQFRPDVTSEMMKREDIKFIGPDVLDGSPVLVYQYKLKGEEQHLWKMWIGSSDGLPRKNESEAETDSEGKPIKTRMNVIYYDYNTNIKIEPPV